MKTLALTLALLFSGALAQTPPAQTPPVQLPTAPPVIAAPVQGAPAMPPVALTLPQAFNLLQQAPGWRAAALQYLSAQQNLEAARARAGLSLSAGASVTAARVPVDGVWSASTTLNVQAAINVLPWSAAQDSVRQATRALYRAGLDQRDTRNTLLVSAAQSYLTLLQNQAALTLAQAQLDVARRQLEVARQQQQGGVLTQEGLLDAQATQEQAQATLTEAHSALTLTASQLYNTLGLPVPEGGLVPASGSAPVPSVSVPLEALINRALQGRSEVLKARSNLEDAQAALSAAARDRSFPDLSASAQYGQLASATAGAGTSLSSTLNFKTGTLSASGNLPLTSVATPYTLVLGLSANIAILNPSADVAIDSARTAVASAQLSLQTASDSVRLDVQQQYAQAQNALSALTAPRTLLTRAQTALASTQTRLTAGLSTALEIQQAQLAVQQAQNTLQMAGNSAYVANLALSVSTTEFDPALVQLIVSSPGGPTASPVSGGQP